MQWTPSQLASDLKQSARHGSGWRPKPEITELLNISDYTHQVWIIWHLLLWHIMKCNNYMDCKCRLASSPTGMGSTSAKGPHMVHVLLLSLLTQVACAVDVGEPIFQPFPPEVVFQGYAPFKEYKATLYLRNNDKVRIMQVSEYARFFCKYHQHACCASPPKAYW